MAINCLIMHCLAVLRTNAPFVTINCNVSGETLVNRQISSMSLTGARALLFALPLYLSSCATLFNGPAMNIHIATDEKIKRISVENALYPDDIAREPKDPGTYMVRRDHETLVIHAQLDSGEKVIRIKPHLSAAFWFNLENYGIGMLVDMTKPERYGYRRWYYLALRDTAIILRRFSPVPKGTVSVSLSVPLINTFSLTSPGGRSSPAGPLGLGAGIDYFYKTNRYISLSIGAATSVFTDHIGVGYYNTANIIFSSIRIGHTIGSFDLGYGLSFSKLLWSKVTIGDTVNMDRSVSSFGIGFSFSTQYRLSRYLRLSILYQPTLFSPNSPQPFSYQHYLAAGFTWTWPLIRPFTYFSGL
jgi:hypothetical protein